MARKSIFKKKLGYFSRTVMLGNCLAVLLLLLSYSASFINPKTVWPIAFLGLGYLPILLINLGFVAYWLLRKPRYALLTLIPILLGWNLLSQHIGFRTQNTASEKSDFTLRIMTYNAHLFKEIKNPTTKDFKQGAIDLINKTDPDILCMQEFFTKIKGQQQFSKILAQDAGFEDFYFAPAMKSEHEGYGQIIFSKFPIINKGTITQNEYGINRIIFVDIVRQQDTIRVYNVHLRSFALQNEDKEFIQNPSANTHTEEKATHRVGRKLKDAFEKRSKQAQALREHIDATRYPVIVMGDFNDTPMSYSVNLISRGLKNTFREKGQGWGVTHYEMLPLFQIDYMLCSKVFQVENYQIVKEKLSDHYPIWADISLLP